MRVLTACREIQLNSSIHNYSIAEFIYEQNNALTKLGVIFDYFLIKKGGYKGYIESVNNFHLYLKEKHYNYALIHAHGGHIGSLVNTQRKIPVITTYHGSDINNPMNRVLSLAALLFSQKNIFVSPKMLQKFPKYIKGSVIPSGVDFSLFEPLEKEECRKELGLDENKEIILFAGKREDKVKNYELAKKASEIANVDNLIELKGYNRKNVVKLINASDCVLLTSKAEGSPMIIKEAMACNCPIVATDVGDIRKIISDTKGCYLTSSDPLDISEKIKLALQFDKKTNGREMIKHFDNELIAKKVLEFYQLAIGK